MPTNLSHSHLDCHEQAARSRESAEPTHGVSLCICCVIIDASLARAARPIVRARACAGRAQIDSPSRQRDASERAS